MFVAGLFADIDKHVFCLLPAQCFVFEKMLQRIFQSSKL